MTYQAAATNTDIDTLPKLPSWVTLGRAETIETVAFRSGAASMVLDRLVSDPEHGVPVTLLANHLALGAAVATSKLEGRLTHAADIRDAYHLTPTGDVRGPDGELLAYWRDAAGLGLGRTAWKAALADLIGADRAAGFEGCIDAGAAKSQTDGPLAACVLVIRAVLLADDRAERLACLLSDIVLARALGWATILPMTAKGLTKALLRDLVDEGQGADLRVQVQLLNTLESTIHQGRDLAMRAAKLRAVAPKLRSKGSGAAVNLFLSEDAVGPSSMLSPIIKGTTIQMTDRAARRFCDRLVELGVAQELTGRATFRLYGIAP